MRRRLVYLVASVAIAAATVCRGDSSEQSATAPASIDKGLEEAAGKSGDTRLFLEGRRYNPKMWAAGYDFSGIARKVPTPLHRSAVALANTDPDRDWIATAQHTIGGRQPRLTFVDRAGKKITVGPEVQRPTVLRSGWVRVPETDLAIAECGELPAGIRKYPLPARVSEEDFAKLHERVVIITTSNGDLVGLGQVYTRNTRTMDRVRHGKRPGYEKHYVFGKMGDSGSPWFMLDPKGRMVVVSMFTTPNIGPFFGGPKVQDWIDASGLPLTRVSLVE